MIKFQNVHKTYKNSGVNALKGVSFLIDDGEFVFIIGKTGSGKSTVLKCMDCEETPDEGAVFIDGFNISSMPRALVPVLRRHIGVIFQDFRLIETKTVSENISFAGEIIGLSRKNLYQKVQLVLNIVGLKDKADAYPHELSGGERQRVAIARAMLNNPKMIVADEPTGNLDPETSENIMSILLEINKAGTMVIVCTHDANLVDKMKKRVIEIEDGRVVRDKEDSAYSDDETEAAMAVPGVSFGDPSGDQISAPTIPVAPSMDFYFGETPKSAARPVPAPPAAPVPAPLPVPSVPDTDNLQSVPETSLEEIPLEETPFGGFTAGVPDVSRGMLFDDEADDDAEVAYEDIVTDISSLPVENIPEAPEEKPVTQEGQVPEKEEIPERSADEPSEGNDPDGESGEAAGEITEENYIPEENPDDDSWLREVRMDDIDLDIQEDDE